MNNFSTSNETKFDFFKKKNKVTFLKMLNRIQNKNEQIIKFL